MRAADPPAAQSVSTGVGWLGLSTVFARGLSAAVTLVLARQLAPADFGLLAVIWVAYGAALLLRDQTVAGVLIYSSGQSRRRHATVSRLSVAASCAVAALLALGSTLASDQATRTVVLLFAAALVVSSLGSAATARLQRGMRFRRVALSELAAVGAYAVLALSLTPFLGIVAVGVAQVVGAATGVACVLAGRPGRVAGAAETGLDEPGESLAAYGAATLALATLTFLFANVDTVSVAALLDRTRLGTYSLAFNLAYVATVSLTLVLNRVAFPAFAARRDSPAELRESFVRTTRSVLLLVVPVTVALTTVVPAAIPAVFGARYAPAGDPLRVLAVYGAVTAVAAPATALLRAVGRPGTVVTVLAAQVAVAVPLCLWLVPSAGTTGAAVAVTVPAAVGSAVVVVVALRTVRVRARETVSGVAGGAVVAAAAVAVLCAVVAPGVGQAAVLAAVLLAGYAVLVARTEPQVMSVVARAAGRSRRAGRAGGA